MPKTLNLELTIDGKELRGSILKGDKRGKAVMMIVEHETKQVLSQGYYSGKKESEQPCVRAVLIESEASHQKITCDALHLNPKTTALIHGANGKFIIGLKENQGELLEDMKMCYSYLKPKNQFVRSEKGHGRLEIRQYYQYDITTEYFDSRWENEMFKSLFKVIRFREELKTGKISEEVSYYISNGAIGDNDNGNYFKAIRNHWSVEVNNHIRDVTLKEDNLRTKKTVTKVCAALRTLVVKLLGKENFDNLIAQLELFQDDFDILMDFPRKVNFL